jgi:UDP-2-acetamido-3-amino-2,3-dideoxy-glucuronate N-acetyltransferase
MKQNIAVVGCGYWGRNLVRNFSELGALHTICDTDAKVLKQVASHYPQANTESEYHRVLLNKEIKGVVIASPAAVHYSMAREALLAGKDVFVEKPFTTNSQDAQELF